MTRTFQILAIAVTLLVSSATAAAAFDSPGPNCSRFEALYSAWRRESGMIAVSSRTPDYVSLPSYRRIVALGPSAVPCLAARMSTHDADFMLAEAVVEICRWDRTGVANDLEQEVRDQVLRRLQMSGKDKAPCGHG